MSNVLVEYSDFSKDNSYVEKITFDLLPSITLVISQEAIENDSGSSNQLCISMAEKETEETAITGSLDDETINVLIRSLSIFKKQMNQSFSLTRKEMYE